MKYFLHLAYRNLFRHKLRTSVSIAAIAISIMIVVFARGLILGMIDSIFSDHIQYQSGHIRIIDQDYQKKERLLSLNYTVDGFNDQDISTMIKQIEDIDGIEMVIPRIKFGSMVATDEELIKMMGWGINPGKEKSFTEVEEQIVEGRMVAEGQPEVVMGTGLLKKINRKVGDKVTILYNTSFNSFKGKTFRIVGEVKSDLKLLNDTLYYVPLDQAQEMLYLEGQVTELVLVTPDMDRVSNVLPAVKEIFVQNNALNKYSIIPWQDSGGMIYYMEIARNIYNVIYVFLVILACFVVVNTMIMIVKERTQEIGMMAALGLRRGEILRIFILEGAAMGILGSSTGAVFGGLITWILASIGLDYTKAMEKVGEEVLINPVIYPIFSLQNMIFGFVLGIIIVTIACFFPARRAANLEPTEALHNK